MTKLPPNSIASTFSKDLIESYNSNLSFMKISNLKKINDSFIIISNYQTDAQRISKISASFSKK